MEGNGKLDTWNPTSLDAAVNLARAASKLPSYKDEKAIHCLN